MPKLIDYPRTSYTGAWELAEITDDTGGKCAVETAAKKLNRKVSGSFKAIIGSAVKYGLLTSKRELLTTTTLFRRIKHAYDKQEELVFHKEAFLTPPLFSQICRKFRSREIPVQMLDVILIKEFGVEEINSQGVAKSFIDGSRMMGLLNDDNIMADIDIVDIRKSPRLGIKILTSLNSNKDSNSDNSTSEHNKIMNKKLTEKQKFDLDSKVDILKEVTTDTNKHNKQHKNNVEQETSYPDTIANLFNFQSLNFSSNKEQLLSPIKTLIIAQPPEQTAQPRKQNSISNQLDPLTLNLANKYQIKVAGPGIDTTLSISDEEDIAIASALLEKVRRQLKNQLNDSV